MATLSRRGASGPRPAQGERRAFQHRPGKPARPACSLLSSVCVAAAVDAFVRDKVEGDATVWTRGDRAEMRAGVGPIFGAGDLQHMFASLLGRHAELVLRRPFLDARDRAAGSEAVMHGLAVERDAHL